MVMKGVNFQSADSVATTNTNKAGLAANTNQNTNAAANTNTAPAPTGKVDLSSFDHVEGTGDWTLIEYSDFDCPFCKQFHPTTKQVLKDYDGKIKLAYKNFPLNIHPQAAKNALAAECAGEQGKFFEFGDKLFENQSTTAADSSTDSVVKLAEELGLDKTKFQSCMDNQTYKDNVQAQSAEAQALGCTGTPCPLLVDKDGNVVQKFAGAVPYATIKATLDAKVK
jgi:protein-disulfide isomerase